MYKGNAIGSINSGLASGVPGEVRGLETLHQKYGVSYFPVHIPHKLLTNHPKALSWRAVVNPAVHIARFGFPGEHYPWPLKFTC